MSTPDTIQSAPKYREFTPLFRQFAREYLNTSAAEEYLAGYQRLRTTAAENYRTVVRAAAQGLDVTDAVLLTLLPYSDTPNNRWRGAWIHVAPTITGDIRRWYEAAGWTQPDDWPPIAISILEFIQTCVESPDRLAPASEAFSNLPYTKGFQSGTLSPILNALRPQHFLLINNRTRTALNYFAQTDYDHTLRNYPAANRALQSFLAQVDLTVRHAFSSHQFPGDIFELFSYWLSAIHDFPFRPVRYWRLNAGYDLWQWHDWMDERYVAIGWDELGDLSEISRREFVQRRDSLVVQLSGWTKRGADQAWRFRRQLHEGDRILIHHRAAQIGHVLLGSGVISGTYSFTPYVSQGHRLPVRWEDLTPRKIPDNVEVSGWDETLAEIDASLFQALLKAPPAGASLAELFADSGSEPAAAPDFLRFCIPIVEYLTAAGGSAEADAVVAAVANAVTDDDSSQLSTHGVHKVTGQIHRARRYLSQANLVKAEARGRWSLTRKGANAELTPARVQDLFAEVEYQRRLAGTLAAESPHIRRLAETALSYETIEHPQLLVNWDVVPENAGPAGLIGADHVPAYSLTACAADTGYATDILERWVRAINRKGQAILYGPPGTGKTFLATHLARHLVAGGDGFVDTVQFHPAYSYEEFVQGIRPHTAGSSTTFPLMPGRFLQFCARAAACNDCCVLIIDEINRADLSQVFGELMYLLEYRGQAITLAGSDTPFSIPANVRILGTMNTADRSIALVDNALRRRFAFIEVEPHYALLLSFHTQHSTDFAVDALIDVLEHINQLIGDKHYALGISYFLRADLDQEIADIWQMEIEPYLAEYFIDQPQILENLRWSSIRAQLERT